MSFTLHHGTEAEPRPSASAPGRSGGIGRAGAVGLAAVLALLCGGGLLLWARYGATVFFDLLSAGFSACL